MSEQREILFRGKSAVNGEWIEGYYVKTQVGKNEVHCIVPFGRITDTIVDNGLYQILPATVGQYTGLTDKNGMRIFEGDIIKGKTKKTYAVEYSDRIAGFITRGMGVLSTPCMNPGTMQHYEVIGNIHDNPELLEGGIDRDNRKRT